MQTPDAVVENYTPDLSTLDSELACAAISSGWVSYAGSYVSEFEREVATAMGFEGSVALTSGTCALQVAFELLGAAGSEVLMPALTFAAPASAAIRAGMYPVFIDLEPLGWQLDAVQVAAFLSDCISDESGVFNPRTGRRVTAVCVVHLWGALADLDALYKLAASYGLVVIQDAAQALGATYRGQPFGRVSTNCESVRTVAVTSFNANKIVTTGGGGALLSNDGDILRRARHLTSTAKTNGYSFDHDAYGLNYRMSNINAALGVAQMKRLGQIIGRKLRIEQWYRQAMESTFGPTAREQSLCKHVASNAWSYCYVFDSPTEEAIRLTQARGIQVRPVWIPLIDLPIYRNCQRFGECDEARMIWRHGVMFPAGPNLKVEQVMRVVHTLKECIA